MTLYTDIVEIYPELKGTSAFYNGTIELQNDSDGIGDYIKSWNYEKPIPDGFTLGKPTA